MNDLFVDDPVFVNFGGNPVNDKEALDRESWPGYRPAPTLRG